MWTLATSNSVSHKTLEQAKGSYQDLLARDDLGFFDLDLMENSIQQANQMQGFLKKNKT